MKKTILIISLVISIFLTLSVFSFFIYEALITYNAHSTFSGYCNWRGLEVVNQSTDFGYCSDPSGDVFKMVEVNGRWYFDGDLPNGWPF